MIAGTFAAVYPSFIMGIQAQSDYEYENGYGYDKSNNNDSYNPEQYPPQSSIIHNNHQMNMNITMRMMITIIVIHQHKNLSQLI